MVHEWLEILLQSIADSTLITPLIALMAGILTSVTPCSLSSIPLIIGCVSGTGQNDPKKSFRLSVIFALGMAVTFITLGITVSMLGRLIDASSRWWHIGLGILMLLMALQMWDVYHFIPSAYLTSRNHKKGYIGAFVAGALGGMFSSHCATPLLVVLLGLVARSGNVAWGILLLLLYSIGHSILVIVAGTSVGFVQKVTASNKYGVFSKVLKYIMGIIILLLAFFMFYLAFV